MAALLIFRDILVYGPAFLSVAVKRILLSLGIKLDLAPLFERELSKDCYDVLLRVRAGDLFSKERYDI
jgi:hypothetical protein